MRSDDEPDELASWRSLLAMLGEPATDAPGVIGPSPTNGRRRLLDAVSPVGRFDRFAPQVAALADVSADQAKAWLDEVWSGGTWQPAMPGSMAWWVPGGPRAANALRGFVRASAGVEFAQHRHLGEEHILVIQGRAHLSTGETMAAGDALTSASGESHGFTVPPGGPDLLIFTVAYGGLEFANVVARPRD